MELHSQVMELWVSFNKWGDLCLPKLDMLGRSCGLKGRYDEDLSRFIANHYWSARVTAPRLRQASLSKTFSSVVTERQSFFFFHSLMRNGLNWGTSPHSKMDRFRDIMERSFSKRTKAVGPNKTSSVRIRMRGSQQLTTSRLEHVPQNRP